VSRSDVVRRYYAAYQARDLPAMLETLDPEVRFEPVLGILFSEHVYAGHAGISRWYDELEAAWDSFEIRVLDVVDTGARVVAFLSLVAHRGEDSMEAEIGVECRFEGERISSIVGRDAWEVAAELGGPRPTG
jgi:ketosteroid isomerase-like protein